MVMNGNDKNSLWDELNIRKGGVCVKNKRLLIITDSNQAYFAKMSVCGVQEEVNALLDEVSVDDRKFRGDTIQVLSRKKILEIPFAISLGWK